MLLMDLNRWSRRVGVTRLFFLPWLISKTTYITFLFHYNDHHVRLEQLKLGLLDQPLKACPQLFDSFNRLIMALMKLISIWKLLSMGNYGQIYLDFHILLLHNNFYCISSHAEKIIFVWPGCILKLPYNTYFPENPVILFSWRVQTNMGCKQN